MRTLIATTFTTQAETEQVVQALVHFELADPHGLIGLLVERDQHGKIEQHPLIPSAMSWTDALQMLESPDEAGFIERYIDALVPETSALLLIVDEQASSSVVLTLLLLAACVTEAVCVDGAGAPVGGTAGDLGQKLETYQDSLTRLDNLDSQSPEAEKENCFRAVDSAYRQLQPWLGDA